MIYVLTGMAKTGKTIVAKELAKQTRYSILSTDYLMMMLHKANQSIGVNADESDPSVSKSLEPYIEAMIETMMENKDNHIIEGVHFLPSFAHRLLKKYPQSIKIIFFGYKDWTPQQKMDDLMTYKHQTINCWYKHLDEKALYELSDYLVKESNKLFKQVESYNLTYVEISNVIFQTTDIINQLLNN